MSVKIKSKSKRLFQLAQLLSPTEMRWLRDALNQKVKQESVLPPVEIDAHRVLQGTFGMWADRDDLPANGVNYVNQIRQSTRWDDMRLAADEID
jgi:hypothetical protein